MQEGRARRGQISIASGDPPDLGLRSGCRVEGPTAVPFRLAGGWIIVAGLVGGAVGGLLVAGSRRRIAAATVSRRIGRAIGRLRAAGGRADRGAGDAPDDRTGLAADCGASCSARRPAAHGARRRIGGGTGWLTPTAAGRPISRPVRGLTISRLTISRLTIGGLA